MAARAFVDRKRKTVVPTTRDVPVTHVAKPVVHALAHVGGCPFDRRVRLEQCRPKLVDRDQPVIGHPPDQRRVAAPAMWVAMRSHSGLEQGARLREPADDLVRGFGRREAVQPPVRVVETARFVHRHQDRQAVDTPELEVLLAGAGRDVDDPGSFVERDVVPRDHPVVNLCRWAELVERPAIPAARRAPRPQLFRRTDRRGSETRRPTPRSRAARTRRRA